MIACGGATNGTAALSPVVHLNGLNEHSEHLYEADVNILTSQAGDAVNVFSSI